MKVARIKTTQALLTQKSMLHIYQDVFKQYPLSYLIFRYIQPCRWMFYYVLLVESSAKLFLRGLSNRRIGALFSILDPLEFRSPLNFRTISIVERSEPGATEKAVV